MNTKVFSISLLIALLYSCSTVKTIALIRKVELPEKEYYQEISFREELNIVIVTIKINDKDYDFMFDTGAINVVSEEIAEQLGLMHKVEMKGTDSQGSNETMFFTSIDKISIGELEFYNTGAAIMDFSENLKELECLNLSGIIGANILRKSVCQIDFENHKIIVANDKSKLNIPDNSYYVDFKQDITGTPLVKMEIFDVECNNIGIDYGSDGYLDLSTEIFNKITLNHNVKYVQSIGTYGKGAFGEGAQDTIFIGLIDSLKMGNMLVDNNIIIFKKSANVIGTDFLKRYLITLDWPNNEMIMSPYEKDFENTFETYGFTPLFKDNKLIVAQIFQNSSASKAGLSIGDEILKINDNSFENLSPDAYCDLFLKGIFPTGENSKEMEVTFLVKGIEKTILLIKENILINSTN